MNKTIRDIFVFPYRTLLTAWWPILERIRRESPVKRLLVCAGNELMAEHLLPVADLVRSDSRLRLSLTCPSAVKLAGTTPEALGRKLDIPIERYSTARMRWWDLILYAEHAGVDQFHPRIPKLLVQHGLDSGKLVDGVDIRYAPEYMYLARDAKTLRYTSMLEPSLVTREKAIASDPQLEGRIAVVGDIGSDEMLLLNKQRRELREGAGYSEQDMIVLIMGTWQAESLMETIGEQIVVEALELIPQYKFIFSTHPNHWHGKYAGAQPWGKFLNNHEQAGLKTLRPADSLAEASVMADIAISDHSSVGVQYALLGKPLIYIKRREGIVAPGTFGARLYEAAPHLDRPSDLGEVLGSVRESYPTDALRKIASEVNAYPGEAKVRIRQEIYRILGIALPSQN